MKIIRTRHEDHFTILPNALIRDERLSYRARGVLMELLSRTPDWRTTADEMAKSARRKRKNGEGRDAMRGAFAELKAAGYIVVVKSKGEDGTHTSELHVYDVPQDVTEDDSQKARSHRGTENQASESQSSADQSSENQASLRSTEDGSTDGRSTEDEESAELAAARSGAFASSRASDDEQARKAELERRWNLVRKLSADDVHEALYALEKKRPRIYRECRQHAIAQYEREKPGVPAILVDQLAYMYALQHYFNGVTPMCLAKPLGIAS